MQDHRHSPDTQEAKTEGRAGQLPMHVCLLRWIVRGVRRIHACQYPRDEAAHTAARKLLDGGDAGVAQFGRETHVLIRL